MLKDTDMTESYQEMMEDGNNVNDIKIAEPVSDISSDNGRYNGDDIDSELRLKHDNVEEDISEEVEEKAGESKREDDLVHRNKRKADCSDLQHKNKLIKLQLQLREAERSIKELKEFEIGFIQTLLDPSMKAAVNTIKAQQQKILQLESKLMDRDAKEDLVCMKDMNKNHNIVKTNSTERLAFFKGIDLFPVDMLKYIRNERKIEGKECIREVFIDGGFKNTDVEPLVTALVEGGSKANLETTLKTVDEENSSDSGIMDGPEIILDNGIKSEETIEDNEPVSKEGEAFNAGSTSNASANLDSETTFVLENKDEAKNIMGQKVAVDAETSMDDNIVGAETMTDSEDIVRSIGTVTMKTNIDVRTSMKSEINMDCDVNMDKVNTMDIDTTVEMAANSNPKKNMDETNNILDNVAKEAVPTFNSDIVRKQTKDAEISMGTRTVMEAGT